MQNKNFHGGKSDPLVFGLFGLFLTVLALFPRSAPAADTTEPFAPGLSDLEIYVTHGGRETGYHSLLVGYGITERWSIGVAWDRELLSDEPNADGVGGFILGTFWHRVVEADLIAQAVYNYPDEAGDYLAGLELSVPNDYLVPYSRLGAAFAHPDHDLPGYSAMAGLSWPLHDRIELLVESEWIWPGPAAPDWELALGLNLMLTDDLELITEIRRCDPGEKVDPVVYQGTVGIIATMEWLGEKTKIPGLGRGR